VGQAVVARRAGQAGRRGQRDRLIRTGVDRRRLVDRGVDGDGDVVCGGQRAVARGQAQDVAPRRGERRGGGARARVAEGDGAGAADHRPGGGQRGGRVGEAVVGRRAGQAGGRREG